MAKIYRLGRQHRHPTRHGGSAQATLHFGFRLRQFSAAIDATKLSLRRFNRHHTLALSPRLLDHIRQIIFALGVVVTDGAEPAKQILRWGTNHAGIAKPDRAFFCCCIRPFHNARNFVFLIQHHAAITRGISRSHGEQHKPC